jgi:hypothetical protein
MGDEPWPAPAASPERDEATAQSARRGWALFLFVIALGSGGLTVALLQLEGLPALSGQRAVAEISRCDQSLKGSCFGTVRTPAGVTLERDVEMPKAGAEGDDIPVRYRSGYAVPDTPWGRLRPWLLITFFAAISVASLIGTVVSITGRGRRPPR